MTDSASEPKTGFVYLIGAGPGDPDLITRRGYDLIQNADSVIYDALIPQELIISIPDGVDKIFVGKRAGKHSVKQDEINKLLVNIAREGKVVCRLKGGDPGIFGRVGEEIETLTKAGIPFKIIPGVTAASAAAADAGMSLTDRRVASWVVFGTGHEAVSDSPLVPWNQFAKVQGGTLVSYMGVGAAVNIKQNLVLGGMALSTAVTIVQNASMGNRKIVRTTLDGLETAIAENNIQPPTLFLFGETGGLYDYSQSDQALPLVGKRILVTRPADLSQRICTLLRAQGAEPIPYPTIKISSHCDKPSWDRFKDMSKEGGWIVFTSEAGVNFFFEQLKMQGLDLRVLGKFKLAVVGRGTERALSNHGLYADFYPYKYTVLNLAEELIQQADWEGTNFVRVQGNLGDKNLQETFEVAGANVLPLQAYKNEPAHWQSHWLPDLLEYPPDYILFTSGSTITSLMEIIGMDNFKALTSKSKIVTIGPMTTRRVKTFGLDVAIEAGEHSVEGVIDALIKAEK